MTALNPLNRLRLIRQVDLFTLRLFLSAVEEQQIGRAAIRENIAASSATKRIQDLEDIAGVRLLERTPKGVVPTPAGDVFARYVREIFQSLDNLRAEIGSFTEGMRGTVALASVRTIIVPFLAREVAEYLRDYPLVHVELKEVEHGEIVQLVLGGEVDVGVLAEAADIDLSGVDAHPYRTDRLVATVPAGHPLASRASVTFEDLAGEGFIAIGAIAPAFLAAARRIGRPFTPRFSVRSAGVAVSLVQENLGVTVLPECLLTIETFDRVTPVPLAEPWAERRIHVITAKGRVLAPTVRAMVEQLRTGTPTEAPAARS